MEHRVKVTVLDKKLFPELQAQYCAVPDSGKCLCYNVGDEFMFYRNDKRDDYWHMGAGTLIKSGTPDEGMLLSPGTMHCGTDGVPFCSEAWDAISRYIYSALQGGAIMHGWMNDDKVMIACCNDGTRPVIFKIERIDIDEWQIGIYKDDEMIRKYVDGDIDAVMQIWLNTNIQAHSFISSDYCKNNFDVVKEMLPLAEIYVYEDDCAKQIGGFIGLNDNYIEGIFVKETMQSKGIGKQLLNHAKKVRPTLKLRVYQKNEKATKFYLWEKFSIQSENVDDNTGENEFIMVWEQ